MPLAFPSVVAGALPRSSGGGPLFPGKAGPGQPPPVPVFLAFGGLVCCRAVGAGPLPRPGQRPGRPPACGPKGLYAFLYSKAPGTNTPRIMPKVLYISRGGPTPLAFYLSHLQTSSLSYQGEKGGQFIRPLAGPLSCASADEASQSPRPPPVLLTPLGLKGGSRRMGISPGTPGFGPN